MTDHSLPQRCRECMAWCMPQGRTFCGPIFHCACGETWAGSPSEDEIRAAEAAIKAGTFKLNRETP
jgi:hypothetical protein